MLKRLSKLSISQIALLQAIGLVFYITLVGIFMSHANDWFGPMEEKILGPTLFLTMFSVSALICALLTLGYPVVLFFIQNKKQAAIELVLKTVGVIIILFLILLILVLL